MKKNTVITVAAAVIALLAISAVVITEGSQGVHASALEQAQKQQLGLVMTVEILVFAVALTVALVFGMKLLNGKKESSAQEKAVNKKGAAVTAAAFIAAIAAVAAGAYLNKRFCFSDTLIFCVLGTAFLIPLVTLGFGVIASHAHAKRINDMRVQEMIDLLNEKRELAGETAESSRKKLRKYRGLTYAIAGFTVVCGVFLALSNGAAGSRLGYIPFSVIAGMYLTVGLMRLIPFKTPLRFMEGDKAFVSGAEFPKLYAMAEEAAKEAGCRVKLNIALCSSGSVGVAIYGKTVLLYADPCLLNLLSEEELGCVLRHEFSHIASEIGNTEEKYYNRVGYATPSHLFSWFQDLLFAYPDVRYYLEYSLNSLACSVLKEEAADKAMLRGSGKEAVASALTKVNYISLYDYERPAREGLNDYVSESAPKDLITCRTEDLKEQIEKRSEFWNELLMKELISRSASHPTLKMRLEAVGVSAPLTLPFGGSEEYVSEVRKATETFDGILFEEASTSYEDDRREAYLEPLETVEKWRADGEPIAPETYRKIVEAMRTLGMVREAEALCRRVVDELPEPSHPFAEMELGFFALRRYDDAGIEHLYRAAEGSSNFADNAYEQIGFYCCLTGNAEELERYRRLAPEYAQKEKDLVSETGILRRSDKLSKECLPDGVLEETLNYIRSVESGEIEKIYLVRKTITADFFTSVFVVKFVNGTPGRVISEIMDKIFSYLDTTTDWQYSLFLYEEVKKAAVERIEGSLVYSKEQ